MLGERRVVTLLFCDITGSTAAAEKLDPEEWIDIVNGAFEHMIRPIYKYEGTVARLMGDAILAFFGAPISHEDDPVRAARAGLDIIAGFKTYQQVIQERFDLPITVRVGINTGTVVVGAVGSDLRMEYTAIGDAINLAARMEQTAAPGTIQIAEDTYKLIAPVFEVEALGGIPVKGKREPVNSYRVLKRKASPGRLRGISGLETRLIGRDREFSQLSRAAQRLSGGVGQLFSLVGEAGLGKSRLTQEFCQYWLDSQADDGAAADPPQRWHQAASYSYETHQPYAIFQRLLRRLAGIHTGETETSALRKKDDLIQTLPAALQDRLTAPFDSLLGFSDELTGETFKAALFDGMPDFFRARFGHGPAVLVLDDIHWSDSASIDLLLHLLPTLSELPLLLICLLRPERDAPSWKIKQAMEAMDPQKSSVIQLHPLSYSESSAMVDELMAISELPETLRTEILEKSTGNPFFVEEIVRTLIDRGQVIRENGHYRWTADARQAIQIPENVQALLMARIDRLSEGARHTLQLAAVIGRSFYERVLEQILLAESTPANGGEILLQDTLSTLQSLQLILEASRVPERLFMFRHALTQEAAYKTILRSHRKTYHLRAGNVLQTFFNAELDENAGLLAHHFWSAGDDQAAFLYLMMAGSRSYHLFALAEARVHFDRAMQIVKRSESIDADVRLALCQQRGRTLELQGHPDLALDHYLEMQILGEAQSDHHLILASLLAQSTLYATPTPLMDASKAEATALEGQKVAESIQDWESAAKILWTQMLGNTWLPDQAEKAIRFGEESLRLAREHDLKDQLPFSVIDLVPLYGSVGRMADAHPLALEAQGLFEATGDLPMLSQALRLPGHLLYMHGRLAEAAAQIQKAIDIEHTIENRWGLVAAEQAIAAVELELGDIGSAAQRLEWALEHSTALGLGPMSLHVSVYLAMTYAAAGDYEASLNVLELAHEDEAMEAVYPSWSWCTQTLVLIQKGDIEAARQANVKGRSQFSPDLLLVGSVVYAPAMIRQCQIYLLIADARWEQALAAIQELLDYIERVELLIFRPETLLMKGMVLEQLGQRDQAREVLKQGLSESEAMGERRMRWKLLAALAGLSENDSEAEAFGAAAAEAINFLADRAGREAHRVSFLAREDVQAVIVAPSAGG
jgi:class 3 adenylate cyclase/tetratricopeptide (TPR) repeat protein